MSQWAVRMHLVYVVLTLCLNRRISSMRTCSFSGIHEDNCFADSAEPQFLRVVLTVRVSMTPSCLLAGVLESCGRRPLRGSQPE
jgi:hypothetical protein